MVAPLPVTAERRHLTIVFCDMVASTEHADRLDPEDFCRLVQTFLGSCADVITRHNGVVASYVGDAVKGFFGYPVADEDDAETAVRAGLEIVDTVTALAETLNEPLQVRVGVASGEVVVGHFAGAPAGVSIGAFGHTANVAARLQVLAEPNAVLVDPPTFQASCGAVDYTDIGFHRLKGLQDPVKVWRAVRPRSLPSRFARRAQLTKLSGRDAEMRQLLDLWLSVCTTGRGRAAVVSGEPGIGKSRLLHEVQRRTDCANWLLMQCSPTFENSTLYPFLRTFKRWASIDDRETPAETMHQLRSALATIGPDVELRVAVIALLLSLPADGGERASTISPDRQREIMKSLVLDWIAHLARSEPLLLLFEDAQWADLTSRELLSTLAETGAVVPCLVLVSLRAEAAEPQIAMSDALHLKLEPLGRADAESIVRDVVSSGLSSDDLAAVLERAEGVPLFIEELAVHAGDALRLERPDDDDGASSDAIPTTMQSALLARLDRLQSAKELAQIAATIGREFEIDLLRSVSGYRPDRIRRDLETLLRSGLLISSEGAQAETLLFKHALLQQAAQATMLRERRQVLHGRIAACLELRDQGGPSAYPELIAHHYTEAGRFDRAADCWFLAGTKTGASWAKLEAARMFRKGLDCARQLADTPERSSRLIRTELELGDVLYAAYGYVTEDGIAAYHRAVALCEQTDDVPGLVRALDGLFGTHFNSAQFDEAIRACDRLIAIGEAKGNRAALVLGLQFKGMSVFCQGRLPEASGLLQRALRPPRPRLGNRQRLPEYGHAVSVVGMASARPSPGGARFVQRGRDHRTDADRLSAGRLARQWLRPLCLPER